MNRRASDIIESDGPPWAVRVVPGYQALDARLQAEIRGVLGNMKKEIGDLRSSLSAAEIMCE
jgi:hypothetical protein